MTAFSHQYGIVNVTDSVNFFIKNNLGSSLPSWMDWNNGVTQPRPLNFSYPDQPLSFPSFSVTHHSSDPLIYSEGDRADGTWKGTIRQGMMEINCWTLELVLDKNGNPVGKNNQWRVQLYTMRDMVYKLLQQNRFITLYDFTTPTAPTALAALIRIKDMRESSVLPDPNPAVKRLRILVSYVWTERY